MLPWTGNGEPLPTLLTMAVMTVVINDDPVEVADAISVQDLLQHLGYSDTRGLAVAVNDSVHPRSQWAQQQLHADDRITLIRAAAGG